MLVYTIQYCVATFYKTNQIVNWIFSNSMEKEKYDFVKYLVVKMTEHFG